MKNKKGFTLIELLAVIVILAIIALIAVPIVLNMINNARKSAAISSTYGYIEAVEMYQGMQDVNELDNFEEGQYNVSTNTTINDKTYNSVNSYIKMKGKKATGGKIHITSGGSVDTATLCMDSYLINYQNNEASIISNDCGDIDLTILFGTNSNEWETSKELTITYPNKNYDKYYKLESGKASIDGNQITVGQEIKAESNEIKLTLEENSKVTAWLVKNNKKTSETSYEEKKIDNVELGSIKSATAAGYPTITEDGVDFKSTLKLTYDNQEGTSAYYSLDNGSTWKKYTSQVSVSSTNIKAKLMRDESKRETNPIDVTIATPKDIITSEAYDNDDETYMTYYTWYNNINYQDNSTWDKYMMVDNSTWGMTLSVKWYCWNYNGYYAYFDFLDSNNNVLKRYSINSGRTETMKIKIPKNSVKVDYHMNKLSSSGWDINSKMYEIKVLKTPIISSVEKEDHEEIEIKYHKSSTQKLYKINNGEWQNYDNNKINLPYGSTIYAKGIDNNNTETDINSYINKNLVEGIEAYMSSCNSSGNQLANKKFNKTEIIDSFNLLFNEIYSKECDYGIVLLGKSDRYLTFKVNYDVYISFTTNSYSDGGGNTKPANGKNALFYKIDPSTSNETIYYTLPLQEKTQKYGKYLFTKGTYKLKASANYIEFDEWTISSN